MSIVFRAGGTASWFTCYTRATSAVSTQVQLVLKSISFIALCLAGSLSGCGAGLHSAVIADDRAEVKRILQRDMGACGVRDRLGKTPVHAAVNFARPEILAELISAGCDVNAVDGTGMTPLHVAAFIDLPGAVPVLLEAGAKIEISDKFGDTPLHTAAMRGSTRTIEELLMAGADPGAKNKAGLTPRALAEKYGQSESARLLPGE